MSDGEKFSREFSRERRFFRAKPERDVDDELAFHLEMRAKTLESEGRDSDSAQREALARFGDVGTIRAELLTLDRKQERRVRRAEFWQDLANDMKYALRRLRKAPGFSLATTIMLTLGVGAVTAVYTVVDSVVLRPLPYAAPEQLVALTHHTQVSGRAQVDQSDASYLLYREQATSSFASMGAYRPRDVNLGAPDGANGAPERVAAEGITASLLTTLGVQPALGRPFRADDEGEDAPLVIILSHALWQHRFGGDPGVIGRSMVVDGRPREIVGVMPATFRAPDAGAMLWLPLKLSRTTANPGSFNFDVIARLKPGVAETTAQRELATVFTRLLDVFASDIPRDVWTNARITPVVTPLRDAVIGDTSELLWTLFASVSLLLAIVVANVASLFLVRAESATGDIAIRSALGAGTGAIARGYLLEALTLAGVGAFAGTALAALAVAALRESSLAVELPRVAEVSVNGRVALFASAVAIVSALVVTLLPVRRVKRIVPARVLQAAARSAGAGRDRQRARSALVVGQVALALVLVASSVLMARSFLRLRTVDAGIAPAGVMTVRVALTGTAYGMMVDRVRFFDQLVRRAGELPGVVAAGVTEWLPLTDDHSDSVIELEDRPLPRGAVPPDHPLTQATPEYFATMGIPILMGRTFGTVDPQRPLAEAIVSRSFARRYWGDANPIGKRLRQGLDGQWFTIVGVAGDVHMATLAGAPEEFIYFPLMPAGNGVGVPGVMALTVRAKGDPESLVAPLREIVRSMDGSLALYDTRPMSARVAAATARTKLIVLVLGAASVVALLVGMVGLYGVLSYGVTLRRREIGVRMALGASPAAVSRMVASRGVALAATGVACGLAVALASTRLLRGLLHDVSPTDPVALAATCGVLLLVAVLASWLPARRAASIAPMEALRRE